MIPRTALPAGGWMLVLMLVTSGMAMGALPFRSATVTRLQNKAIIAEHAGGEVKASRPAVVDDVVLASKFLQTSGDARAELQFPDKSLARVGANTIFTFDAQTRTLTLEKGDMLFYLPPGAGGVKIKTAALTAALTGTVVLVKETGFLVLEGTVTITYKEDGEKKTLLLEAGTDHNAVKKVNGRVVAYRSGALDEEWTTERSKLLEWFPLPDEAEEKIAQYSPWASEDSIFSTPYQANITERFPFGGILVPPTTVTRVPPTTDTNAPPKTDMNVPPTTVTRVLPEGQVRIFDQAGTFLGLSQ